MEELLMTTTTNGRERKSLAEQIDRLDGILDGLAQGLEQAVVAAVQAAVGVAVREVVQAVLQEVLANPEFFKARTAAAGTPEALPAPTSTSKSGLKERLARLCGRLKAGVQAGIQAIGVVCAKLLGGARRAAVATRDRLGVVVRFRVPLLLALAAGTLAGTAAYFAGPWVAAGMAWLAGFVTTVTVQAGLSLRRRLAVSSHRLAGA
jgi:hypothetical protein